MAHLILEDVKLWVVEMKEFIPILIKWLLILRTGIPQQTLDRQKLGEKGADLLK